MFVNHDKFQTLLLHKQKANNTGAKLTIGSEDIQILSLLGVKIVDKLIDTLAKY